jgi:hypothetical protein
MNRVDIEVKLNKGRIWVLEMFTALPEAELLRGATVSEHDHTSMWTPKDHLVHVSGIELNFNAMIRRHLAGDRNPVGLRSKEDGSTRTMEEIMAIVHEMTERWVREHRSKSLSEVVAVGQRVRADTLALLAELTDEQLGETLPGAPWADGTIGGVLGVNADHGRTHWQWARDGMAVRPA